jgi:protein TonB
MLRHMKQKGPKYPDLNDLAFSGRNKDYGSYVLRKKYPRSLLFSFIISVLIIVLNALIPLGIYYFRGQDMPVEMVDMFSVEYTFIPSPDDDLEALAKAVSKPPPAPEEQVPVVVDTVVLEKNKMTEEEKKVVETDVKTDSAATARGSENGTGSSDETGIYTTLDVYPRFPGGPQALLYFLRSNVKYPQAAMKSGIQGEVMVLFMVEADGSVTNVSVAKGIGKECDEEAMRVFRIMPRWDPGRRYGKPVKVLVRMPVVFNIPGYRPPAKKEK